MKSSEVCIKTRPPPASLPIQDQVTKLLLSENFCCVRVLVRLSVPASVGQARISGDDKMFLW